MGDESPTRRGIGEAPGAFAGVRRRASVYGVSSRTLAVMRASAAALGTGITDSEPWNIEPLYWPSMRAPPGWGPRGFAAPVSPLPLSTNMRDASRSNSTPVGYQPTGIHPRTTVAFGVETSATVTVLLSALATSSVRPSGESARPLGVEPTGAWIPSATEICSEGVRLARSTAHTALVFAQATNRRAPSRLSAIALGCSPTGIGPKASFGASVEGSSRTTLAPPQIDT